MDRPLRGMVLAAGLGTRLRPLTEELPKPLCPVGGRPPASVVVDRLAAAGVDRIVINVHHLAAAWDGWAERQPVPIVVVREPGEAPLGTAGGIANARADLGDGDVVLWNGDVIAEVDVAALVATHRERGAFATLAVRPRPAGEGAVGLDDEGRVVRLRASSAAKESRGGDYAGVAVLSASCVASLPPRGCLVGDAWIPFLIGGGASAVDGVAVAAAPLVAWSYDGPFRDVGSLAEYLEANLEAARSAGGAIVDPTATVARGVTLDGVVIGAGARIDGEGALQRVVVWPGARASGPLTDAVVTSRGVVRVAR